MKNCTLKIILLVFFIFLPAKSFAGSSCNLADLNGDGTVDTQDLLILLGAWGDKGGAADFDNDGTVGVSDLLILLGCWNTNTTPVFPQWGKIEISFTGPFRDGLGDPNPFLEEVEVTFTSPSANDFVVPAFFNGDNQGGYEGDQWLVRFNADEQGIWNYVTSSKISELNGQTGSFEVEPPNGEGLFLKGRLEGVGEHYLRFQNGDYWLKGGADDPEDFLANPHLPSTQDKLDAIDFLAQHEVNSLYIMTHNIAPGDCNNVWPWVGDTPGEAQSNTQRFNLAKLQTWEEIFTYMEEKGLVIHLVLEDDSNWTGFDSDRELYYRELVARFSHHNGLIWNISEEFDENYSTNEIMQFADIIRGLDPYDHPITVHHSGSLSTWDPFIGESNFDLTSFQTANDDPLNDWTVEWWNIFESTGQVVSFDETGKLNPSDRDLSRQISWGVFLGGGMLELHTWPLYRCDSEDPGNEYGDFIDLFDDLRRARLFVEENSFWQFEPKNELVSSGYCFAKEGITYLIYLPQRGSVSLDLRGFTGEFSIQWLDPVTGNTSDGGTVSGGGLQDLGASPFASPDAVVKVSLNL